jgi:hypothetical protein
MLKSLILTYELRSLDADYPLLSLTFLPLGSAINRVPLKNFLIRVVVRALGSSRSLNVSQSYGLLASYTLLMLAVVRLLYQNYTNNNRKIIDKICHALQSDDIASL